MDLLDLALSALPLLDCSPADAPAAVEMLFSGYVRGLRDRGAASVAMDARLGFATSMALAGAARLHWALTRVLTPTSESVSNISSRDRLQAEKIARVTLPAHAFLPLAEETLAALG
jgi:hypothetical protein